MTHQIVTYVEGERTVLVETEFCDSAFDYYCYYLREYLGTDIRIEGDCNGDLTDSEHW
jgi:hypothetical protein